MPYQWNPQLNADAIYHHLKKKTFIFNTQFSPSNNKDYSSRNLINTESDNFLRWWLYLYDIPAQRPCKSHKRDEVYCVTALCRECCLEILSAAKENISSINQPRIWMYCSAVQGAVIWWVSSWNLFCLNREGRMRRAKSIGSSAAQGSIFSPVFSFIADLKILTQHDASHLDERNNSRQPGFIIWKYGLLILRFHSAHNKMAGKARSTPKFLFHSCCGSLLKTY